MNPVAMRLLTGSIAGFAASGPMTVLMESLHDFLPHHEQDPLPPRQITENVAEAAGLADDLSDDQKEAATMAAHMGYAVTAGAVYGVMAAGLGLPPALRGAGFGLALWAGGYLGWLPATGLYRPATREPLARNILIIAAHLLWGATLGLVDQQLADGSINDQESDEVMGRAHACCSPGNTL